MHLVLGHHCRRQSLKMMLSKIGLDRAQCLRACSTNCSRPVALLLSHPAQSPQAASSSCSTSNSHFCFSYQRNAFVAKQRVNVSCSAQWGSGGVPGLEFIEGYTEVDEVKGLRVLMEAETPRVEYLVKWKVSEHLSKNWHATCIVQGAFFELRV
jgi:hypothetical protein